MRGQGTVGSKPPASQAPVASTAVASSRLRPDYLIARLLSRYRRPLDASERQAILLAGDVIAINLALATLIGLSESLSWSTSGLATNFVWFALLTAIWLIVAPASDCYRLVVTAQRLSSVYSALRAGLLVIVIYILIPYISPPLPNSRLDLLVFTVITLGYLVTWRFGYSSIALGSQIRHRVLIVGTGSAALAASQVIRENLESDYEIAGFVASGAEGEDKSILKATGIDHPDELVQLVESLSVAEVVVATTDALNDTLAEAAIRIYERGVKVTSVASFYESVTGRVPVEHVGPNWFDALPGHATGRFPYVMIKRAVDIVGGLGGLVCAVAAYPLIALVIRLDSPGPVLYHQTRVGKGGRPFTIHKYRTMPVDATREGQSIWTRKQDRTITKVGRLLRATRMDELPQFWNILRGDMSLVGPRPYIPDEIAHLETQLPFFRTRLLAAPGLTGWAQVRHGYGTTPADELMKLQYDIYYIKHQSLYLDLLIVLRTLQSVLRLTGR